LGAACSGHPYRPDLAAEKGILERRSLTFSNKQGAALPGAALFSSGLQPG
jgi:hypothetical protein